MDRIAMVAVVVMVAGCCAVSTSESGLDMVNPASAHCVEQGGVITIEDQPQGQVGFCTLPDGTRIEEWELYRRDTP